jgi:hypothetical protein
MMKIPDSRRGLVRGLIRSRDFVRCWGLAAAATLMLSAVPGQRAEALSLINPGGAPAAKHVSDGLTTEVRGGHGGGGHGGGHGGGGFHGGGGRGFHGGGAAFHGGGFRGAHVVHGGGFRYGGYRFAHGQRFHRHHFHRRFYYAPSYSYYSHRYCRVIWTYYGPRKICRYRPWHHHHWRYHHRRHHRHHAYW